MRSSKLSKSTAPNDCEPAVDQIGLLYEKYAPHVAAYAMRRSNRADAADVVAETFLVAWRRRQQIPNEPMTLPWLYGVARRVLANQHRANRRRGRLNERLASQFTHDHSPASRIEAAEGFEHVAVALRKLSADDAEVLRLCAWEDLSPTEIASVMDLQPEAVRQRLHRARKRLRKQLEAEAKNRKEAAPVRTYQSSVRGPVGGARFGTLGLGGGSHGG